MWYSIKKNSLFKYFIMERVKCFIIGLGNISVGYDRLNKNNNKFYTHSKSINFLKSLNLLGGCDISKKKRDFFSNVYKKPVFKNIDIPIAQLKPSLVVLSTPTNTHLECVKILSKYPFVKTLICEKPLSNNINEAKKIVAICKKKKIKLFVNYFRISDPSTQELKKKFIKKKNIFGYLYYSRGYFNNCSHFFNLFENIFGNFKEGKIIGNCKNYKKNDLLFNFYAKFGDATIFFFYKNDNFDQFKFDIFYEQNQIKYRRNGEQILFLKKKMKTKQIKNLHNSYQLNVYNELIKFFGKKNYFLCSGKDALKTINNMYKVLNDKKI